MHTPPPNHTHTQPRTPQPIHHTRGPPIPPPGEQLNQLSGIAAVLRFPLPELEDAELIEEA